MTAQNVGEKPGSSNNVGIIIPETTDERKPDQSVQRLL